MPGKRKRRRKRWGRAVKQKLDSLREQQKRSEEGKEKRSTEGNVKTGIPPQSDTAKSWLPAKSRDRVIAGVCSGLAPYTNADVGTLRLIFVLSFLITGGTIATIAYIALAILMPPPDDDETTSTGS
ncbi:MAG: PspC domain-containing protein [Rhodothermaceae bacterium]|nr:PspC domain-containing protein [Rhodothermaceae bacterium]MXX58178.1 PspC domain-containing protein [Rhodothermaceae bacterium]MYD18210.1 PspC domain-containing protein [Rhodothermaceae bacterium]MYD57901.1 PspC domain-containing protein [Rhodothermaceae bacterium]MYI43454.1 PspC domain-containing protein [Rhodothermaceae bacterium]